MTKDEAIDAMKRGEKVTHRYFSNDEWMTIKDGKIETEDGCRSTPFNFWLDRIGPPWQNGYSIFKPKK